MFEKISKLALIVCLLQCAQPIAARAQGSEQQMLANLHRTEHECGAADPRTAEYLFVVGKYYHCHHDSQKEALMFNRAMSIFQRRQGKNGDLLRFYSDELARIDMEEGKQKEAEALFKRALAIGQAIPGKDKTYVVPNTLAGLAELYSSEKRYPEAETALKERIEMRHRFMNYGQVDVALVDLANLYTAWGRYDESKKVLDQLLTISPMPAEVRQAYTAYLNKTENKASAPAGASATVTQ